MKSVDTLIERALEEDLGSGDVTSVALLGESDFFSVFLTCRESSVLCGVQLFTAVFKKLDPEVRCEVMMGDGSRAEAGTRVVRIQGRSKSILAAERVALNFIQRLSGIATLTRRYVDAVKGTGVLVLDTRKTTPGWRILEKYAVRCGGGVNHRQGLFDLVMVKDNHLAALKQAGVANPIGEAVKRARRLFPHLKVEVEADSKEQARMAVEAGADMVLLDNMEPSLIRDIVTEHQGRVWFEASGGIQLSTAASYAETGVNALSLGALTHSARSVDFGLDFHD